MGSHAPGSRTQPATGQRPGLGHGRWPAPCFCARLVLGGGRLRCTSGNGNGEVPGPGHHRRYSCRGPVARSLAPGAELSGDGHAGSPVGHLGHGGQHVLPTGRRRSRSQRDGGSTLPSVASGGWSTADTVQTVAAGAQVVAAGFTLTLALMTKGLATKTKQMAEATKNMADETRRVADSSAVEAEATKALVVEAQKDRALSWSPYLSRVVLSDIANASGEPLGLNQVITLSNLGKGQALRCTYVAFESSDIKLWCIAQLPGLRAEETVAGLVATPQYGQAPTYLLRRMPDDNGQIDPPLAVLICEDVFGNRHRFLADRFGRDTWHPGDTPVPTWAISPLLWN